MENFYKTLLTIRKKNKALQENATVLLVDSGHKDVLTYLCRRKTDRVLVILNLSRQAAACSFDHPALAGNYIDLFEGSERIIRRKEEMDLEGGQYLVLHITGPVEII